jgi:glycerate 2-kinase
LNLLKLAQEALSELHPSNGMRKLRTGTAVLCWGKAAAATAQALVERELESAVRCRGVKIPSLLILPRGEAVPDVLKADPVRGWRVVQGEHPLPGPGSLEAGSALLDLFDDLRRHEVKRLEVFLSGGASSLAWLPPAGVSFGEVESRLRELYARPLSIARLNAERSKHCQLKAGGASRWLRALAPEVRVRVQVVSDVSPFGAEIVGSGPFWDGRVSHRIVADNRAWVRRVTALAREARVPVLDFEAGRLGPWQQWVKELGARVSEGRRGMIVWGGEPQVDLRRARRAGRGGRQTQIAAALLENWADAIAQGRLEVLCLSSDGVDGRSGAAGAWLRARSGVHALKRPAELRHAVRGLDSATLLGRWGGLVPSWATGTNVQDLVVVWVL